VIQDQQPWLHLLFSEDVEGGLNTKHSDEDPGGLTNHGITRAALARHRSLAIDKISDADIAGLKVEEAQDIALSDYWNPARCSDLPAGLDILVADCSFNSGPAQAVRILQRVLGFVEPELGPNRTDVVDGFVGAVTLKAVAAVPPRELCHEYHDARLAFLQKLAKWPNFGAGWAKRNDALLAAALTIVPVYAPLTVARSDKLTRRFVTGAGVALASATTIVPLVVASVPAAQQAYQTVAQLFSPYAELAPWLTPVVGGLVSVAMLYLNVRASQLQHAAVQSGSSPVMAS
jgi:lysozyme family protein